MMLKFIKLNKFSILFVFFLSLIACKHKIENENAFSYNKLGYYYRLISFDNNTGLSNQNKVIWLDVSFATQSDSVFWDSYNNFNDNYFIKTDKPNQQLFLKNYIYKLNENDSACLLLKPKDFYLQHFNTDKISFFSINDSVVKIYFKVKQVLTLKEFNDRKINLASNEIKQIESYFKTIQDYELSFDSLGFYWIEKPNSSNMPGVNPKSVVKLSYEGSFLNGRVFEKSPNNFELIYGIPDQIIKGLNYVIKQLKKGQNAKIILPSRLAFGENGSSNGIIAPYTPLIYKVNIIDIKNE